MQLTLPALTIMLYLAGALAKGWWAKQQCKSVILITTIFGGLALLCHMLLLYHWIDTRFGQNLALMNVVSMVAWLMSLLVWLAAFHRPVANLLRFTLPLSALSIVGVLGFPSQYLIQAGDSVMQLLHIVLSMVAFSVFFISGFQAMVIACLHHRLHSADPRGMGMMLPPIETMEVLLFQMIGVGFVCLTISMLMGLAILPILKSYYLPEKIVFSLCAWVIFAVLLYGRCVYGWRGRTASYGTILGVAVLGVAYFGTRIL